MITSLGLFLVCAAALVLAPALREAAPLTIATGFRVEQIHKTDMKTWCS